MKRTLILTASAAVLLTPNLALRGQTPAPSVTVGIAVDGPWSGNDEVMELFRREITDLLVGEYDARFPASATIVADWTVEGVQAALDRLLSDPEVDVVLTLGVLVSHFAATRADHPKPVFAPVIIDPTVQGLPQSDGTSGAENLSYLALPRTLERDLEAFQEIRPFERLVLLISAAVDEAIPGLSEHACAADVEFKYRTTVIAVENAESALAAIPPDAEAVYVLPLLHLPEDDFDRLVRGLIDRRLPSFSRLGELEVEQGLMAARNPENFFQRLARRVALNIQSVLLGEEPGDLPFAFAEGERLTINMTTARAIGVYPPWKVLTEATLVGEGRTEFVRTLSLEIVAREALDVNLDLAAAERGVRAGEEDVALARSTLLPEAEIGVLGAFIDSDRAAASLGVQSERTFSGSAFFRQLLFSEPAWANLSVQGSLQRGREFDFERDRLDVVFDAAVAYLNVLRAKTFERIQTENLRVTRSNLELARIRQAVGEAGPAEVYRWENQLADNRRVVIDLSADRNRAEIELNRILDRPLEEPFQTIEIDIDDESLLPGEGRFLDHLRDPWTFRLFRSFMAAEALVLAPELRALDAAIDAQDRARASATRSYWAPEIAFEAGVTNVFARGGAGTDVELPSLPGGPLIPETNDIFYSLGFSATLPIFQGLARPADVRQQTELLLQLETARRSTEDRVEQRVRSALHEMGASFAAIDLSREAAAAARRNFDLVRDSYARGVVSILDLLDAQNQALVAELVAANEVYRFVIDLMEVQRAVGRYDFFATPEERDDFFERLETFIEEGQR